LPVPHEPAIDELDIMMPASHHQDVRTTLTLDEDVAAKLKAAARRSGRPFRDVVNEALRRGLMPLRPGARQPFRVSARSLGGLRPGLRIDNVEELLDQVEGSQRR
jgi:hypothetical protein